MKFLLTMGLALALANDHGGGNTVGGNGNAVSAFFVRAAHVLQQAMEEKEKSRSPFVAGFDAATFRKVLATPVILADERQLASLKNEAGETADIKVVFDAEKNSPKIYLNAVLWSQYLDAKTPDYRMVLHAYLYAGKLDDRRYQHSSLVPIESLGLPEVMKDEAAFHEFDRPIGLAVLKSYVIPRTERKKKSYIGVSADRTKAFHFNANGILTWEYDAKGKIISDIRETHGYNDRARFLVVLEGERWGEVLEDNGRHAAQEELKRELGRVLVSCEWDTLRLCGSAGSCVEIDRRPEPLRGFFQALSGKILSADCVGYRHFLLGGHDRKDGNDVPIVASMAVDERTKSYGLVFDKPRPVPLKGAESTPGRVTAVVVHKKKVWLGVNYDRPDGPLAVVYALDGDGNPGWSREFPGERIVSMLRADWSLILATDKRLTKFEAPSPK